MVVMVDCDPIIPRTLLQRASRFAQLQDRLTQGLSSLRGQRVNTLTSFGKDAANAQFTAGATGPLRVAGLAQGFSVTDPATIAFGIRLQGGIAEVREGGVYRKDVTFAAGDVFRIGVQAGVVTYSKNGTVFYTSGNQASSSSMVFGVVIANLSGAIANAVVASGL